MLPCELLIHSTLKTLFVTQVQRACELHLAWLHSDAHDGRGAGEGDQHDPLRHPAPANGQTRR